MRARRRRDKKALAKLGLQGYLSLSLSLSTQFLFSFGSALVCLAERSWPANKQGPIFCNMAKNPTALKKEAGRLNWESWSIWTMEVTQLVNSVL